MKVFERLAMAFAAEGVTAVFGIMGTSNEHWIDALNKQGVRTYEVRHEGAGLGMADGWARATREVTVATATGGPGVSQLASGLITASRAASPVVVFVGEYPTDDQGHNQRLDQSKFAEACESGFVRVATPAAADEAVRLAFHRARSESRPILLSAPLDVQMMTFHGGRAYSPASGLPRREPVKADSQRMRAAADLIMQSRRPVILVARGAQWSAAGPAVLAVARRIGALISTSVLTMTWLAEDDFHAGISGRYTTATAAKLFEDCDCLISVGASDRFTLAGKELYPGATRIHVDEEPLVELAEPAAADLYIQADPRLGLEALEQELSSRNFTNTGYRTSETRETLATSHEDRREFALEPGLMDPREVCSILDDVVPESVPLVVGNGSHEGFACMGFVRPRPFVLPARFFDILGQAMPAALGVAAGTGEPVLLVDGDSGLMMHLAEFETAVRYKWPILIVVQNNEAMGAEYYHLLANGMDAHLARVSTPDLGNVGLSLGGNGRLVRDGRELRSVITAWLANPRPTLVDVRISLNVLSITAARRMAERGVAAPPMDSPTKI